MSTEQTEQHDQNDHQSPGDLVVVGASAGGEELQATDEELETTNEELQARTQELQELDRTLANERWRLAELVDLAPFYILVLRGRGLLVEAFNPKYARLFAGRDVAGHPLEDVFQEEPMAPLVNLARDAYRQNKSHTTGPIPMLLPDAGGRQWEMYFVYTVVPTHDSSGRVDGLVVYANDVTEQIAREAEERREQLKLMIEHADQVALGLYDAETTELLQASRRYLEVLERVHGYPRDSIIGRKWEELSFIQPREEAVKLFNSVIHSAGPKHLSEVHLGLPVSVVPWDEQEMVWDISLVPVTSPATERLKAARFVVVSAIEMTEQVRARAELERLDHTKGVFLSLASHELRAPLVPLMGYADMLADLVARQETENAPGWDKRIGEYVGRFRKQLNQLNAMIDDLLDVARLETGRFTVQKQQVDLERIVQQVVEEAVASNHDHTINYEVGEADKPLLVLGDEVRLQQVVSNLLQNALVHAPDSKQIDVRLRRQPGATGKDEAVIDVQDSGPGIPPEAIAKLFTQYFQVTSEGRPRRGGLGVGLFIARGIVEQHGGTISVESEPGKGSTFTVRLPLV